MSVETTEWIRPEEAYARARDCLLSLQRADGSWEGEMVWNTMILSQYVITLHLLGRTIPADERARMVHHYEAVRLPDHRICERQGVPIVADRAHIGAGSGVTTAIRRPPNDEPPPTERTLNRALAPPAFPSNEASPARSPGGSSDGAAAARTA